LLSISHLTQKVYNMPGLEDRIKEIEEEIQKTPYNKATQHHIGRLKARLAQLRERVGKGGGKGRGMGFAIKKGGDATVALVGFPSVGKSTLLNRLTDAKSRVGGYEFTTTNIVPGIMSYKGARIQILDLPGMITGASVGRGRGREILSIIRNVDLILILLDVFHPQQLRVIEKELYDVGIRLGQKPPGVSIKRTAKGGIRVISGVNLKRINERTIREILNVNGIHSADVMLREDIDEEQFIDAVMKNRVYIPSVIALNKIDMMSKRELDDRLKEIGKRAIPISAINGENLGELRETIFRRLGIIRVYMRPRGGVVDFSEPLIVKRGSTVGDVCDRIHKGIREKFRYAIVRGRSAKFDGQSVGIDHILEDGDILTIVEGR